MIPGVVPNNVSAPFHRVLSIMPANDNRHPPRVVPIIGFVGDDGAVTIIDPTWRPAPQSGPAEILAFPNAPQEA